MVLPKWLYNIFGNFGIGAVTPLLGGGLGETIFDFGYTGEQLIIISILGASCQAVLSISKEALERGKAKWK